MARFPATEMRLRKQYRAEARVTEACPDFEPRTMGGEVEATELYPKPLCAEVNVLGVIFDPFFTLGGRFTVLTHRAQVRQGGLARVARAKW